MGKKTLVLKFPQALVDKPITYKLVKDYDLKINILKANITIREGNMVLGIEGPDNKIKEGIEYLKKTGVEMQPLVKDIELDSNKCTDCTYCVTLCPTEAFIINRDTMEVSLDKDKCIACGICVSACPYKAIELELG